jgi:hypothetical protein
MREITVKGTNKELESCSLMKQEYIKESLMKVESMGMELLSLKMEGNMKECGNIIR